MASHVPPLWTGGPDPAGYYAFPQKTRAQPAQQPQGVNKRTMYPITTGEKRMQGREWLNLQTC